MSCESPSGCPRLSIKHYLVASWGWMKGQEDLKKRGNICLLRIDCLARVEPKIACDSQREVNLTLR